MPRSNKDLEADVKDLKAIIEDYKVEVAKLKADAADFSLKLISNDDMLTELARRDALPQVPTADTLSDHSLIALLKLRGIGPESLAIKGFSDDELIFEMELRKLEFYAKVLKGEPANDVVKKEVADTLYHAGEYTCNVRSYNDDGKIYNFGSSMTLGKDTRLSEKPQLRYFTPGVKTESTSLTPFGDKFNKKVPNTAQAKYQQTFKDNPALKGQGKGMPTPPGN